MLANYFFYPPQLPCTKTKVKRKRHRIQPELSRLRIAINMNVRRLIGLMAVKVDAVRAWFQDRWHDNVRHLKNKC